MKVFRVLGSLKFASFLISILTLILIVSTSLESLYGTEFALKFFYRAGWFDALLGLIGLNVLIAALYRFPFKKRHTAFLLTHLGIFILLVGALITRIYGVEGRMSLLEGESKKQMTMGGYELSVSVNDSELEKFNIAKLRPRWRSSRQVPLKNNNFKILVHKILEKAVEKTVFTEGLNSDPVNHAIKLTLFNDQMGIKNSFWLAEENPFQPHGQSVSFGPLTIKLSEKMESEEDSGPRIRIIEKDTDQTHWVHIEDNNEEDIKLADSDLIVTGIDYLPNAKVQDGQLVNVPESSPNPAVRFQIRNSKGQSEQFVKFGFFPDYDLTHGKKSSSRIFDLKVDLVVPPDHKHGMSKGPVLAILYSGTDWTYKTADPTADLELSLSEGKTFSIEWMNFSVRVDKIFNHALIGKQVFPAEEGKRGQLALETSIVNDGQSVFKRWLFAGSVETALFASEKVILRLVPRMLELPFALKLIDFRKIDYPGTRRAAAFESDVILMDEAEALTEQHTISMNNPLDYKGFRVFQSSYGRNPSGESSVFQIAKDPGIPPIYLGSCVMFFGIFLLFYVKSFSSLGAK